MRRLLALLRWETEDRELLQSVARKVMGTTLGVYAAWHIIATLGWPEIFSPSLYLISAVCTAACRGWCWCTSFMASPSPR